MLGIIWNFSNIAVVFTAFFLVFIFLKYGTKKVHHILVIFNTSVGTWGLGCFVAGLNINPHLVELAWKIAILGALFSPIIFYRFIVELGNLNRSKLLTILYVYAILFSTCVIFNLTGLKIVYIYETIPHAMYTDFRWVALIISWTTVVLYAVSELLILFLKSKGEKRIQFQYLFIGFTIGFAGAILETIPFFNAKFFPIGNFLMCVYSGIVAYAILKHKLICQKATH